MAMMPLTIALARAIAWDAGNRSMRKAGRSAWDEADWNVAAETARRLWPLIDGAEDVESANHGKGN
jgi:hypothetical protein